MIDATLIVGGAAIAASLVTADAEADNIPGLVEVVTAAAADVADVAELSCSWGS